MATKYCPTCGRTGGKTAKCCSNCGRELVVKPEPPAAEPAGPATLTSDVLDAFEHELAGSEASLPTAESPDAEPGDASSVFSLPLSGDDEPPEKKRFVAKVCNGLSAGRSATIAPGHGMVIGTSSDADLVLDGDDYASRKHAMLVLQDGKLLLTDQGSTNGTFVVVKGTREVRAGDVIIAGKTLLTICLEE